MNTFDHVIIGGGILGLSIAYHLARDSRDRVLVLERNELASAASSRAAGLILQVTTKQNNTPLSKLTCDTIPLLEEVLGEAVGFHGVGSIRIAASPGCVAELETMETYALDRNVPFQNLSLEDVVDKAPWLSSVRPERATFFPTDGYVDPYTFSTAYGRAARQLGAEIRPRVAVKDLIIESNRVSGVRTSLGDISAGTVTNAAGAWASVISARAGFPLPMAPTRSHYWITVPNPDYGGDFPVTLLPDSRAYARSEVGGMLIGIQEKTSATFDARELPDDIDAFSPTQGEEHWDILAEAMADVSQFFPAIERAQFSSYISGLSAYTPDGAIVLGPIPGYENFFAAAGCCGNGISLSAGIGAAASALVRGDTPGYDLTPFAPGRFGLVDPFSRNFQLRCAAARASKSRYLSDTNTE